MTGESEFEYHIQSGEGREAMASLEKGAIMLHLAATADKWLSENYDELMRAADGLNTKPETLLTQKLDRALGKAYDDLSAIRSLRNLAAVHMQRSDAYRVKSERAEALLKMIDEELDKGGNLAVVKANGVIIHIEPPKENQ